MIGMDLDGDLGRGMRLRKAYKPCFKVKLRRFAT